MELWLQGTSFCSIRSTCSTSSNIYINIFHFIFMFSFVLTPPKICWPLSRQLNYRIVCFRLPLGFPDYFLPILFDKYFQSRAAQKVPCKVFHELGFALHLETDLKRYKLNNCRILIHHLCFKIILDFILQILV